MEEKLNSRRCLFTNADRLRSMTDEELAEWFDEMIRDCTNCDVPCRKFCTTHSCEGAWLEWLRQEASDG